MSSPTSSRSHPLKEQQTIMSLCFPNLPKPLRRQNLLNESASPDGWHALWWMNWTFLVLLMVQSSAGYLNNCCASCYAWHATQTLTWPEKKLPVSSIRKSFLMALTLQSTPPSALCSNCARQFTNCQLAPLRLCIILHLRVYLFTLKEPPAKLLSLQCPKTLAKA